MKHVLKRLLDRAESNSLDIDKFRSQLGSVNIYFDTCDLELYASVRGSIDSDIGYNHIWLFSQEISEPTTRDAFVDKLYVAADRIESILSENLTDSEKLRLVREHKLSLTIITDSLDEEFKLFVKLNKIFNRKEFDATFGERYVDSFRDFSEKELIRAVNSSTDDTLPSILSFFYQSDLVKVLGKYRAKNVLISLVGDSKARSVVQDKITDNFLSNKGSISGTFTETDLSYLKQFKKEYSSWNDQFDKFLKQIETTL